MTRERVIGAIVLLLLALGAWWFSANTEWVEEDQRRPAQGEARENPAYAFEQLLRRLGLTVAHHEALDAMPPPGARLVLLSNDWQMVPERAEQLHQWVKAGGHLVLTSPDDWEDTPLDDWVPVHSVFSKAAEPPEPAASAVSAEPPASAASAASYRARRVRDTLASQPPLWGEAEQLIACGGVPDDTKLRVKPNHAADWALVHSDRAQVLRVPVGEGSVTVLNTGIHFFFNNYALDCGHPLILAGAVQAEPGATAWVYLHEKREPLLPWLWHKGWIAVVALGLALAATLWRAAVRFGPRLAAAPRLRRSISEQVRGLGAYLQGSAPEALLAAQQRALIEVAGRHLPRFGRLAVPERARAIAAATGLEAGEISAALSARFVTRAQLPHLLQVLETARRRLAVPLVQPHTAERGASGRSPEGTAVPAGSTGKHSPERAGSGAAQRSARNN